MSSSTPEEWRIERERLSNQIEYLEQKVNRLSSESSSQNPPPVDGILREFRALGRSLFKGKHKKGVTVTPQNSEDGLLHITPKNIGSEEDAQHIDELVKTIFKLYVPPPDDEQKDKKSKYLNGNFGPVGEETPPTRHITVEEGHIPRKLNGMMLRNGPNPRFTPEGRYVWLDGDSMIHGIHFKHGKAIFVARYTQTSRYIQQLKYQKAQLIKFGDLVGPYGLFASFVAEFRKKLHLLDSDYGISTANTGLVYHAGRIMALEDFGQPHVVYVTEDSDLQTVGINNYNGKLKHWLSPHPKIDPATGEMFNMGSLRTSPYCKYRVISKEGVISDELPITVSGPTYMHELCITKNYVIFQDLPSCYDLAKMMTQETEWIFNYNDTRRPRYGILPRYATKENQIKWFEFPGSFFVYHNVNAWEEDDGTIVIYCCVLEAKLDEQTKREYIAPAMWQHADIDGGTTNNDFEITWPQLYKLTFDMKNNTKHTKEKVSGMEDEIKADWPKINENYVGRKNQYAYLSRVNDSNKIVSVIKYDMKHDRYITFEYCTNNNHTYGSEVVFVPKTHRFTTHDEEDDGYLITFVHREDSEDSSTGTSYVYVIDAKTMKSVAKIRLPSRVPYGFHALYVTEKELEDQIKPIKPKLGRKH